MKILFSDLDGTLIDHDMSISEKNLVMMNELKRQGHLIALCTGRNILETKRVLDRIDFPFDYLVLNNGGHILDKDMNTLYEKTIDKKTGIDILKHTTQYPQMWSYFCDGHINYGYIDGKTVNHGEVGMPEIDIDFHQAYQNVKAFQIIAFNQDNEKTDDAKKCVDYIQQHYSDDVEAYFNTHFVDVVPQGCSKGTGMRELLKIIDENIDEVYAIGDSYNDLSMLKEATHGYTFFHAADDMLKQVDKHVNYVYDVIEDMLRERNV